MSEREKVASLCVSESEKEKVASKHLTKPERIVFSHILLLS